MAQQRDQTEEQGRAQERLALWRMFQIDPEAGRRAEELAQQGRWEELRKLVVDTVRAHPVLMEKLRQVDEALARGDYLSDREVREREERGRAGI